MVVGGFTVRAVVFTVVMGCSGVCHYQQLLDVTLEEKKKKKKATCQPELLSTDFTDYRVLNWVVFPVLIPMSAFFDL